MLITKFKIVYNHIRQIKSKKVQKKIHLNKTIIWIKNKNLTKLLLFNTQKRDFFDLVEFLNDFYTLSLSNSKKTSSKADECVKNLKIEDGKNWTCKVKYHKKSNEKNPEPLFCACYYEYLCGTQIEKFHFSKSFMIKLKNENKQKDINRGPDYQCEKLLFNQTEKTWTCTVKKEVKKPVKKDDEFYCECFHQTQENMGRRFHNCTCNTVGCMYYIYIRT